MMKKSAILGLLLFLSVLAAMAVGASGAGAVQNLNTGGGPWEWVNPPVQGSTINAVSFVNSSTGWAVGIGGTILKTTDGGNTWAAQVSGTSFNLEGVKFVDANSGWAVGADTLYKTGGIILHTSDGGTTWTPQSFPSPANFLSSVSFSDGNNGVAVGTSSTSGYACYTADGGKTWMNASGFSTYVNSVQLVGNGVGFAVGYGAIYKTIDGGNTWTKYTGAGSTADEMARTDFRSVVFIDANNGYAVGAGYNYAYGRIASTNDGGVTWHYNSNAGGAAGTANLSGGAVTGVAITNGGSLYDTPPTVTFSACAGAGCVTATGTANISGGAVTGVTITNPGSGYTSAPTVTFAGGGGGSLHTPLQGVAVAGGSGAHSVIVVGDNGIIQQNSGVSWTGDTNALAAGLDGATVTSGTTSKLMAVVFPGNGSAGFAAGESGAVTASTDSGATWTLKAGGAGSASIYGSSFIDSNTGWMVGSSGTVVKTTDGGASWTSDASGIPAGVTLQGVQFLDSNTGFAVGCSGSDCITSGTGAGVAYKYTSGTWAAMGGTSGSTSLKSVHMSDATHGWAVGKAGIALQTSDGSNWVAAVNGMPATDDLNSVYTTATGNAWAVGCSVASNRCNTGGGVILKYSGGSWTSASETSVDFFSSIDMVDASTGYAVGGCGSGCYGANVYKTTDGGATWSPQVSGTSKLLASVSFSSPTNGFVVGDQGRVIHTTDGGATWYAESPGTNIGFYTVSALGDRQAFAAGSNGSVLKSNRPYYFTWYDSKSPGASDWVLMANPSGSGQNLSFSLFIGGAARSLPGGGTIVPGQSINGIYPGVMGGPVNAASLTSAKAITSQRTLWGSSLEEVLGQDIDRLSDHYYWTWYDDQSQSNWILVANPNPYDVYCEITIAGTKMHDPGHPANAYFTVPAGGNVTPTFPGAAMGGPVEVQAWTTSGKTAPASIMASQRVLSNNGSAFNEVPGTAARDLSSDYLWTWYDQKSANAQNWVLVANPNAASVYYQISIAGGCALRDASKCSSGQLASGAHVTPQFPGIKGGPVEVKGCSALDQYGNCGGTPENVIASQRSIFGPSFEEVPGSPRAGLTSSYYWTWYDQKEGPAVSNWVLVANPTAAPIYYEISMPGVDTATDSRAYGKLNPGQTAQPQFDGIQGGPVNVSAWTDSSKGTPANVMASQRVLWQGYFNETLGTNLN
ncbi:MAG: YCF48-related protein [Thermoleophilia bacterium]